MRLQSQRHYNGLRSTFTMGLGLLVVFLLATHWAFCAANSPEHSRSEAGSSALCSDVSFGAAVDVHGEGRAGAGNNPTSHTHMDVCCKGVDETHNLTATYDFASPRLVVTLLLWAVLLVMLVPVLPRAAVLRGRDGPVSVVPLHTVRFRVGLPHRAPPVFFA